MRHWPPGWLTARPAFGAPAPVVPEGEPKTAATMTETAVMRGEPEPELVAAVRSGLGLACCPSCMGVGVESPPAHPAPAPVPVPGTGAGYLLATVSRETGRIQGWTHATPLSRAGALAEAALARRGETVPRLALCRVVVEEVING